MKHYPGTNPGDDPESYTLEGAKATSHNCALCTGHGLAPVYANRYQGSSVEYEPDRNGKLKPVVLRGPRTAFVRPAERS